MHVADLFPGYTVSKTAVFRVTRNWDLLRRRGGVRGPAVDDPGRAAPARSRRGRAPGDRRGRARRSGQDADLVRSSWGRRTSIRIPGPLQLNDAAVLIDQDPRPETARRAADAGGAARAARRGVDRRRHRQARRAAAPPLRVVRSGGALHRRGRRRSQRARDQADALSHQRRQPDRARALSRAARERQAGHGAGRDQGALRRGEQHRLGAPARGERRPRRLRPHRAQDALQGGAGGAARGRRASAATCTSAPATTTRRRRASTPICRSSRRGRRSPTT